MKDSITSGIVGGVAGAITGLVAVGAVLNHNTKKKENTAVEANAEPENFQEDSALSDTFTDDTENAGE